MRFYWCQWGSLTKNCIRIPWIATLSVNQLTESFAILQAEKKYGGLKRNFVRFLFFCGKERITLSLCKKQIAINIELLSATFIKVAAQPFAKRPNPDLICICASLEALNLHEWSLEGKSNWSLCQRTFRSITQSRFGIMKSDIVKTFILVSWLPIESRQNTKMRLEAAFVS